MVFLINPVAATGCSNTLNLNDENAFPGSYHGKLRRIV